MTALLITMVTALVTMLTGKRGMWRKLFGFRAAGKGKVQSPEARGYLRPLTVLEILDTENRQGLLKQIRDNSLMTKEGTEKYYLQPLRHCLNLMQQLPATEKEHHAVVGGLVDFTLKRVAYALRLSRGYMLPQGAGAEEQSAQAATWNAVIFYAALCRSLTVFGLLEGELTDGTLWFPGLSVPSQSYRLRFCQGREERAQALAVLLGMRLLPEDVVIWLGRTPAALDTLLRIITGEDRPGCVVTEIISEASVLAGGQLAGARNTPQPVVPEPVVPAAAASVVAPGMVVPATGQEQATVAAPAPGMVLGSALDGGAAAVTGNTVVPPTPQPASVQEEPADQTIGDVMALMGFSTTDRQEVPGAVPGDVFLNRESAGGATENDEVPEETVIPDEPDNLPKPEDNSGRLFWQWLCEGLMNGEISVNTPGSAVHIICGFVFISVPAIFYQFIKSASCVEGKTREQIQAAFERLGVHKSVNNQRCWQCSLYEKPDGTGGYKKFSGYLIQLSLVYPRKRYPEDSMFLKFSRGMQ
ncbi:TraI domain-containing protein [Salmonella enterica]|nr:TraI domain-containing protein [Salmonella enterica]MDJ7047606.1 TraI domain-containing protein [Salmonella enterica]MDJ7336584.1 TraI domain-containing protein [Salmonella enterica]